MEARDLRSLLNQYARAGAGQNSSLFLWSSLSVHCIIRRLNSWASFSLWTISTGLMAFCLSSARFCLYGPSLAFFWPQFVHLSAFGFDAFDLQLLNLWNGMHDGRLLHISEINIPSLYPFVPCLTKDCQLSKGLYDVSHHGLR